MIDKKMKLLFWLTHPAVIIVAYVVLALAPLGLAYAAGIQRRGFLDEVSSAFAMVAFSMLLIEFVLSGRFRNVSSQIGIDLTMRFHQLTARLIIVFIMFHPFLYTTPFGHALPWDQSGRMTLGLDTASFISGVIAWLLLGVLVAMAVARDKLPYRYETWRLLHGLGAAAIAIASAHHAITAGRYSGHSALETFWLFMVGIALLTLLIVYVVRPLSLLRHPYRVVSVEKSAMKIWTLVIEPTRGQAIDFDAGQFVWLTLNRSPFAITEHPFSIGSCPADRPRLGFTIKEAGDFTNTIGTLEPGARAFVDGPYGNLTLSGRTAQSITLIAGGVGIAPIMSILRQLRAEHDRRVIKLIYGNRVAEQIVYRDELEDMTREMQLILHLVLSEPPPHWGGPVGSLDQTVLAQLLNTESTADSLFVVCGPPPMIDSVEGALKRLGIETHQIISEKFSYD